MTARDPITALADLPNFGEIQIRFWSKVQNLYGGSCWTWTAAKSKGYGKFSVGVLDSQWSLPAHRLSYFFTRRVSPGEMQVCHTCDNRACCRPDHLFLGTNDDNLRDMISKGRNAKGSTVVATVERRAWGEKCGQSKLTESQVREIRLRYAEGQHTMKRLGAEYGVIAPTICYIVQRKTWAHLD